MLEQVAATRSDFVCRFHAVSICSRYNYEKTYNIVLGANQVVPGMEDGLLDMCVGEKRHLVIPPHLGYGERGVSKSYTPTHRVLSSDAPAQHLSQAGGSRSLTPAQLQGVLVFIGGDTLLWCLAPDGLKAVWASAQTKTSLRGDAAELVDFTASSHRRNARHVGSCDLDLHMCFVYVMRQQNCVCDKKRTN